MDFLKGIESVITIVFSGVGLYLMYKYEKKNKMSPKLKEFYYHDLETLNELRMKDEEKFSDKINDVNLHIQIVYESNKKFVATMKSELDELYGFSKDENLKEFQKMKNIEISSNKIRVLLKKEFKL